MAKKQREYRRLPGRGIKRVFFSAAAIFSELYLGKGHLLCVEKEFASENYKRFYYQDIQAITTRKSARGMIWNIALFFLALSFILINIRWGRQHSYIAIACWIITGLFLFFLMINWMRGQTCICRLITPIHTEELPSLNRLRTARKAIGFLSPLIEQAQGRFTKEELEMKAREFSQAGLEAIPGKIPLYIKQQRMPEYYHGSIHMALYCLLLFSGGLFSYGQSTAIGFLISTIGMAGLISCFVLAVVALVRQHNSNMNRAVKINTWATLGYLIINGTYVYISYIALIFKNPKMAEDYWELMKLLYRGSLLDSPFFLGYHIFILSSGLILGLLGIILTAKFRRAYKTPPPVPPAL